MKAFAALGFVILAFFVWWPAGVGVLLLALWMAGKAKDGLETTRATSPAVHHDDPAPLLAENLRLQHELVLRDIQDTTESIRSKVDAALEDKAMAHPSIPAYHAWQIISDLSHDTLKAAYEAGPEMRASMLALLQYIDGACDGLVRLVSLDERWKLYAGRKLEFEDFRQMRGLARVVTDDVIRLATKAPQS